VKLGIPINALAFAYVYPFEIFGGQIATSVVIPTYSLSFNIAETIGGRLAGLSDIFSDVFFWSKNLGLAGVTPGKLPLPYGLTFAAGFAGKAPTGAYNPLNPLNVGNGIWLAIPNFALTYTTGPNWSLGDSTQLSTRFFFGVPFTNPHALGLNAAGYTSGNVIDLDWSASQLFGNFRIGVAGAYLTQVSNDTTAGGLPTLKGNRYTAVLIGPVIEYTFPGGGILKMKYQNTFHTVNFVNEQFFVATFEMKLW
jgi:hypothetical protein